MKMHTITEAADILGVRRDRIVYVMRHDLWKATKQVGDMYVLDDADIEELRKVLSGLRRKKRRGGKLKHLADGKQGEEKP